MTDAATAPSADAPAEEFLELPGGRAHLFRAGAGEPLLFLHAAGGAGTWLDFHRLLAGGGFDVIAPDHPGFGKSDDFPEVEAVDDLVYHYLDLLDALGLERAHVVGASFGGWIAAELAVAAPAPGRVAGAAERGRAAAAGASGARPLPHAPGGARRDAVPQSPGRAGSGRPAAPDIDAILAAYRDATALARFSWVPFLSNPKLERLAAPGHRADAGGRAVRRPAHPGGARAAVRVADTGRALRRGPRLRARDVLRAARGVRRRRPGFLAGNRLPNGVSR